MEPTAPVAIAVVGAAGLIGRRHVRHIREEPQAGLHSIVDPTPRGKEMAQEYRVAHFHDLDSLLASPALKRPDAIVIATPSSMHGIHVLVEKPLCRELAEVGPLVEASKQTGAGSILLGFHRRFNPYIQQLKRILTGESTFGAAPLGTIVAVNALWCARKPASYFEEAPWRKSRSGGGGVILTNLSHELDLMRFLLGDITRVYAEVGTSLRGFEVDETVAITIKFAQGCVGTIILSDSALTPHTFESATGENPNLTVQHQPVYTIMGTAGTLNFPNFDYWSFTGGSAQSPSRGDWTKPLTKSTPASLGFGPELATDKGPQAPFSARLRHWVDVIHGRALPNCSLDDGIKNMVLLEAVRTSAQEGKPVMIQQHDSVQQDEASISASA